MSNLPPGVSDSTFGAPWNDEEFGGVITLKVYVAGYVQGPNASKESLEAALTELDLEIHRKLSTLSIVSEIDTISKELTDV